MVESRISEPNAPLGRRRVSGTLKGSADGVDGANGGDCCRTSTVDWCVCIEHRTRGDLIASIYSYYWNFLNNCFIMCRVSNDLALSWGATAKRTSRRLTNVLR